MKKFITALIALLVVHSAIAQTSYYKYVNEPTISSSAFLTCLTTSTGYIFAGNADNLLFDSHLFIARTSAAGVVQQIRSFPNPGFNSISSTIETIDGKIAYWGTEGNNTTFVNALVLLKTDLAGNFLITKTFSSPNYSLRSAKMLQDAQGNYFLLATATNTQTFQDEICLLKTDASGNMISQKFIDLGVSTSAMDIITTAGNGFLITGYANNGSSIETIALFKLDANLAVSWSKWYSSQTEKYFHYDIKEKTNGNFILCGRYDDNVNPYSTLIMEISNSGNLVWAKKYPGIDNSKSHGYAVQLTTSGDAIVAGGIDTGNGNGPAMAMSVNANSGIVNWSKKINSGAAGEAIFDMQLTSGGELVGCGSRDGYAMIFKSNNTFDLCSDTLFGISEISLTLPTQSASATISNAALNSGNWSLTPSTFTTLTDACSSVGIDEHENLISFSLFPNPVSDQLNIESEEPLTRIKISDITGRQVIDMMIENKTNYRLKTSGLTGGIYTLQTYSGNKFSCSKFLKSE